jgi:voltage-gated potassium channel
MKSPEPIRTAVPNPARAAMRRFVDEATAVRWAIVVLIVGIVVVLFAASLVVWLLDSRDYPDYGSALWFTLQTVTTVGYGDDVPRSFIGQFVAGVVMIVGIAFITILTALITSALVDTAQERRHQFQLRHQETVIRRLTEQFDEMNGRMTRIEAALGIDVANDGEKPAE